MNIGDPSVFACPDCHGVLMRLKDVGVLRFRCHTGHAYSAESLLAALNEGIENALWSAVRAADEGRLLLENLLQQPDSLGAASARIQTQLAFVTDQAELLREMATRRVALIPTQE